MSPEEEVKLLRLELQKAHREAESLKRGFLGDQESITIRKGGAFRHVTCLQCNVSTVIANGEPITATASEIGQAIIDGLNSIQDESPWKEGLCEQHQHLS